MNKHVRLIGAVPVVAAMLAGTGCTRGTEPKLVDFERMRLQQRLSPYVESNLFPDSSGMRVPPAGTVPYDALIGPVATGKMGGVFVQQVPIPITPALLREGRERFSYTCATCHGPQADGNSVVASNMETMRPPSLVTGAAAKLPPGTLFAIATHGIGRMPPLAWLLTPHERWAVIAYIRTLQQGAADTTGTVR